MSEELTRRNLVRFDAERQAAAKLHADEALRHQAAAARYARWHKRLEARA